MLGSRLHELKPCYLLYKLTRCLYFLNYEMGILVEPAQCIFTAEVKISRKAKVNLQGELSGFYPKTFLPPSKTVQED